MSRGSTMKLPASILAKYPTNTACIKYQDECGKVKHWFIGSDPRTDNEETLRAHLKQCFPNAEFLGWAIKSL